MIAMPFILLQVFAICLRTLHPIPPTTGEFLWLHGGGIVPHSSAAPVQPGCMGEQQSLLCDQTRLHGDGIVPRASPLRYNPRPSSKSQISGLAFLDSNFFEFISIFSIFFLLFLLICETLLLRSGHVRKTKSQQI
jgi:hypothetical protein